MSYPTDKEILELMKDRVIRSRPLRYGHEFVDKVVDKLLRAAAEVEDLKKQCFRPNNPEELVRSLRQARESAEADVLSYAMQLFQHVKIHHSVREDSRRRELYAALRWRTQRKAIRKEVLGK